MLILSAFPATAKRVTAEFATRRNEFLAALADEVYIAHATPGGHLERLASRVREWGIGWEKGKSSCADIQQNAQ